MTALILASASTARSRMLDAAGILAEVKPAAVDEEAVKASLRRDGATARDVATLLAEAKAERASGRDPEALVIGGDSMLTCGDTWFDKPPDRDHARAQLQALRGKPHRLYSAVALARGGSTIWRHVEYATLQMRDFSDAFLDAYLAAEGDTLLGSVGAYRLEGLGAQLFSRIEGDHFVIQGLPLLALLEQLRVLGVLPR